MAAGPHRVHRGGAEDVGGEVRQEGAARSLRGGGAGRTTRAVAGVGLTSTLVSVAAGGFVRTASTLFERPSLVQGISGLRAEEHRPRPQRAEDEDGGRYKQQDDEARHDAGIPDGVEHRWQRRAPVDRVIEAPVGDVLDEVHRDPVQGRHDEGMATTQRNLTCMATPLPGE